MKPVWSNVLFLALILFLLFIDFLVILGVVGFACGEVFNEASLGDLWWGPICKIVSFSSFFAILGIFLCIAALFHGSEGKYRTALIILSIVSLLIPLFTPPSLALIENIIIGPQAELAASKGSCESFWISVALSNSHGSSACYSKLDQCDNISIESLQESCYRRTGQCEKLTKQYSKHACYTDYRGDDPHSPIDSAEECYLLENYYSISNCKLYFSQDYLKKCENRSDVADEISCYEDYVRDIIDDETIFDNLMNERCLELEGFEKSLCFVKSAKSIHEQGLWGGSLQCERVHSSYDRLRTICLENFSDDLL